MVRQCAGKEPDISLIMEKVPRKLSPRDIAFCRVTGPGLCGNANCGNSCRHILLAADACRGN